MGLLANLPSVNSGRFRPTGFARRAELSKSRTVRRRVVTPVLLVVGALVLGGCKAPTFGAFRGATTQAHAEFKLWVGMFIVGLVVAIFVWGLIFWSSFRYRRKDDTIPHQFHSNVPVEITYTIIPIIIVALIFYFTVITENQVDAVTAKPAEIVHVDAFRWGWRFSYFDGANKSQNVIVKTEAEPTLLPRPATSNQYPQLELPKGEDVTIVLTSSDVIHGFYIPAFNFSRYALPGVTNKFDFTPTDLGVYPAQCSQFCGLYHAEMIFSVKVVTPAGFSSWLQTEQASQAQPGGAA